MSEADNNRSGSEEVREEVREEAQEVVQEVVQEELLEEAAREIRACRDCPLGSSRTNAVPGCGPASARVMFIAEGPGKNEDEQGVPFVGPAGEFLEDLLPLAGLAREDVFITNMIKCQAPGNRDPRPEELAACEHHLDRQIEIIQPEIIVTLGRFSLGKFLPGEKAISHARGKLRHRKGRFIFPIMHPAAGLRRNEFRDLIVDDFEAIPDVLRQVREDPPPEDPEPGPATVQTSLF